MSMTREQFDKLIEKIIEKVDDNTEIKVVNMTKDDVHNADNAIKALAETHKDIYDAHVAAGFNEEQAFIILTHLISVIDK